MSRNDHSDNEFKHARAQLDRAVTELDELSIARLRAARKRIVAQTNHASRAAWWLPLSTAAIAVLVTVTLLTPWSRAPESTTLATEEIEQLMAGEDPDFFTNLDFYEWLDIEREAG